ncbi:restriction endonuclease subunit S [Mycoplasmopsis felis]|uniref:Type I restriction-modification system specificity subunit n=1 Tax=Mycoplasmopsis felis TaxID=33923 RepID=A0A809RUL6_9BACT|nr:restriction endonuclease subunit S [Mycoplasmopsis felis]BBU47711.1 type I restriction-modification system specificity subunit [Mycoplasmopsis felis]
MKKVLVPKVRFKGFSEEWKEDTIGNIANITNGKLDANAMVKSGMYNFYTSGIDVYKIDKYSFEGEGISIAGNGVNMGYMHLVSGKYNAYQRTYILNNIKIDRHFLFYNLWKNFWEFCQKKTREGSIPYLLYNDISDFKIFKSHSNEQQKIGKLLDQISNLITLEEIKINKLKQLKETLLQKMFPEGNSKTPRIRFRGFDEEWSEEKLDDIFKVITGGEPPKNYKNSKHPVGKYKYPIYSNGQEANAIWGFSDNYSINTEAITISSIGTIGFPVVRKMFFTPIIRLKTLLPYNKNMNINFLNLSVSQINFSFNQAGISSMNSNQLKDNIILISRNFSEQQKIGDFFCKIDTLINLYQSKLKKLKQIKEALLQKMFV